MLASVRDSRGGICLSASLPVGEESDCASRGNVRKPSVLFAQALCLAVLFLVAVATPVRGAIKDSACISCHEDRLTGKQLGPERSSSIQEAGTEQLCAQVFWLHGVPCGRLNTAAQEGTWRVDCARCHRAVSLHFKRGVHGVAFKRGDKDAPSCTSCHGTTAFLGSRISVLRLTEQTRLFCALNATRTSKYRESTPTPGYDQGLRK